MGVVCGFGLAGRRPQTIIRYQGFSWLNASFVANYAAKVKQLSQGRCTCPVFVRAIAAEGGVGPVSTGCHHGLPLRAPGLKVCAPATAAEWRQCWQEFLDGDDPVWCSECRAFWPLRELKEPRSNYPRVTVVAVGSARLSAARLPEERVGGVDAFGLCWLKPLRLSPELKVSCERTKRVLVVDGEHETCGAAEHVALAIHKELGVRVDVLGLPDRTAGSGPATDLRTPTAEQILESLR